MNKILEIPFGSHLYGTSTPESDQDFKGIYLPEAREIIMGTYKKTINISRPKQHGERNTKDDIDIEYFSLDRFLELLCDGQTVALDMLFSPDFQNGHPVTRAIWHLKDEFLNKNVNAFIGYARQQAHRYGIRGTRMDALYKTLELLKSLPDNDQLLLHKEALEQLVQITTTLVSLEKEPLIDIVMIPGPNKVGLMPHLQVAGKKIPFNAKVKFAEGIFRKIYDGYGERAYKAQLNGGRDYKALSHCLRVCYEAIELLNTGHVTFPRPEADLLIRVKKAQVDFDQVSEFIEQGLLGMVEAQQTSTLKEEPNRKLAQDLVYTFYLDVIKNHLDSCQ